MAAEQKNNHPMSSTKGPHKPDPLPWVSRYVANRLNEESAIKGREYGFNATIAKATGVTPVHVGKVRKLQIGVGNRFARALEEHWGLPRYGLEKLAADWWARSDRRTEDLVALVNHQALGDPVLISGLVKALINQLHPATDKATSSPTRIDSPTSVTKKKR
jgi:hypothetical protein